MKPVILIFFVALFVPACIWPNECGNSIELAKIELSKSTLDYVPYSGNPGEGLVFVRQNGATNKFYKTELGMVKEVKRENSRQLCDEGFLDTQYEYYTVDDHSINFNNTSNDTEFEVKLTTFFDDSDPNDIKLLDLVTVTAKVNKKILPFLRVAKYDHNDNQQLNTPMLGTNFIGDTVLFGDFYKSVMQSNNSSNTESIYYNEEFGVITMRYDSLNYLYVYR